MLCSLRASATLPRARLSSGRAAAALKAASISTTAARRQASPAPEPPKMVKLTVNGKEVEVVQGTSLIQACQKAGAVIPHFCYHERVRATAMDPCGVQD